MKALGGGKAVKNLRMAQDVAEGIERTAREIKRTQIQIIEASCRYVLGLKRAEIEQLVIRLGSPKS